MAKSQRKAPAGKAAKKTKAPKKLREPRPITTDRPRIIIDATNAATVMALRYAAIELGIPQTELVDRALREYLPKVSRHAATELRGA